MKFVRTSYGWAKVLYEYDSFLGEIYRKGYRLKFIENSYCPNLIDEFFPKDKIKEIEEVGRDK